MGVLGSPLEEWVGLLSLKHPAAVEHAALIAEVESLRVALGRVLLSDRPDCLPRGLDEELGISECAVRACIDAAREAGRRLRRMGR